MLQSFLKRFSALLIPCLLAVLSIGTAYYLSSPAQLIAMSHEDGVIEDLTFVFLVLAAVTSLFIGWKNKSRGWYLYAFFMTIFALREIDAHSMFTVMSILKSRFYVSPEVPINEKLGGGTVILIILFMVYKSLHKLWPTLKQAYNGVNHALMGYTALGFLTVAKCLDSFFRLFPSLSYERDAYDVYMRFAEESLEMAAGFLFLSAAVLFVKKTYK